MQFIDDHRARFGVEPICRVLTEHGVKIAPSGYYAARARPPSTRELRDARVLAEIRRLYHDRQLGRGVYGVRKVWLQLRREGGVDGHPVPRCQVERLMRQDGLRGVVRGRSVVTTRSGRNTAAGPSQPRVHRRGAEPVVGGRFHLMGEPGEVSGAPLVAGGWPLRFHRPGSCRVCVSR